MTDKLLNYCMIKSNIEKYDGRTAREFFMETIRFSIGKYYITFFTNEDKVKIQEKINGIIGDVIFESSDYEIYEELLLLCDKAHIKV